MPIGVAQTAGSPVPGQRLEMGQLPVAVPQRRPLRAPEHAVVAEDGIHVVDGILEYGALFERSVECVQPIGEGQGAEHGVRVRGDGAIEACFDRIWYIRGRRNGRRVRDERGQRDRRGQAGGWSQADRRCQCDGWGQRDGRSGRKVAVNQRLHPAVQQEGNRDQDDRSDDEAPSSHHAVAAHAEEAQALGAADGYNPSPDEHDDQHPQDDEGSLDSRMDIQIEG